MKPKARESSAIIFDANESRIIIFGGWSNAWLQDMYQINVSTIIGPPYAIYKVKPKLGPLTGKTKITIEGDGFKDSQNIVVRFATGKFVEEVQGIYVDEKTLTCESPSFEKHGAKKV